MSNRTAVEILVLVPVYLYRSLVRWARGNARRISAYGLGAEPELIAVKNVGVNVPVIVRLEGTNADVARKKLADSGLAIIAAKDLTDAAVKAVTLARGGQA